MSFAGFRHGQCRFITRVIRLDDAGGRKPSGLLHAGGRCRRIHQSRSPCVPHRHARRAVRGMKRQDRSEIPSLPPCRRRETNFRRPSWQRLTSFPHHKRRPRLAATPCGVSEGGMADCRHCLIGRGKTLPSIPRETRKINVLVKTEGLERPRFPARGDSAGLRTCEMKVADAAGPPSMAPKKRRTADGNE